MDDLKRRLLSPKARTSLFTLGWAILAAFGVSCLIGVQDNLLTALGVIGVALLVTANSLAIRAVLWRAQANLTATKSWVSVANDEVMGLLNRNAEGIDRILADRDSSRRSASGSREDNESRMRSFSNSDHEPPVPRTILPDEPYLANYLISASEGRNDPTLIVGDFESHGTDSLRARLEFVAASLGIDVEIVSSVKENSPVWDVRSYKQIAILPHDSKPAPLIPFSWIEPRAQIHVLAPRVHNEYLKALNYGTEVKFAHLHGNKNGVEVKVRRSQA